MSNTVEKDFQSAIDILAKVKKPQTTEADYWWNSYLSFFKSLKDDYIYLSSYFNFDDDAVNLKNKFKQEYDKVASLQQYRHSKDSSIEIKITHKSGVNSFCKICLTDFTVGEKQSGILFRKKKNKYISFEGYDYISDTFIGKHFYHLKDNLIYRGLKERETNNTLKKIVLIEDPKMNDWDYCYG